METHSHIRARWEHVAATLRTHREGQQRCWGDIDDAKLGRYLVGEATQEERRCVEKSLEQFPELRKIVELVGRVLNEGSSPGVLGGVVNQPESATEASVTPEAPRSVATSCHAHERPRIFRLTGFRAKLIAAC